tara:strand:+ start:179 stop:319 length:141 start_codon:yes stop_codon:yes gene_type:complete
MLEQIIVVFGINEYVGGGLSPVEQILIEEKLHGGCALTVPSLTTDH